MQDLITDTIRQESSIDWKNMPFEEAFAVLIERFGKDIPEDHRNDIPAVLKKIRDEFKFPKELLPAYRAVLRHWLLGEAMTGGEAKSEYQLTFSGSGDGGNYDYDSGNDNVDWLLIEFGEIYIHWDWYNGDGGGGDITWNLASDTIMIEGYYNETVSHSVDGVEI